MDLFEILLARKKGGGGGAKAHVATYNVNDYFELINVPGFASAIAKISDEAPSMSDLEGSLWVASFIGLDTQFGIEASTERGTLVETDFQVAKVPTLVFGPEGISVISVPATVNLGGVTIPKGLYQVQISSLYSSKIIWIT